MNTSAPASSISVVPSSQPLIPSKSGTSPGVPIDTASTPLPSSALPQSASTTPLSTAGIAGIAIGVLVVILNAAAIFWFFHKRRQRRVREEPTSPLTPAAFLSPGLNSVFPSTPHPDSKRSPNFARPYAIGPDSDVAVREGSHSLTLRPFSNSVDQVSTAESPPPYHSVTRL